jgi:hypothetical protein
LSILKAGIPTKLIKNSPDPFTELNEIIYSNDEVIDNIKANTNIQKCIFDTGHLDFFAIKKLSDFLFTKKTNYFNSFVDKSIERIDELLNKYSGHALCPEDIILVHTCSSADSLYFVGVNKKITYPFISLGNKNGNEFFIATARNYIYSCLQDI